MSKIITDIELTDAGAAKFNTWFSRVAALGVRVDMQAVSFELLATLENSAGLGEDFTYELGRQFTRTGRPEVLSLNASDVIVTTEEDDD